MSIQIKLAKMDSVSGGNDKTTYAGVIVAAGLVLGPLAVNRLSNNKPVKLVSGAILAIEAALVGGVAAALAQMPSELDRIDRSLTPERK